MHMHTFTQLSCFVCRCIAVIVVLQALAEKGVTYTSKYTDLFNGQSLSPEYLAINPRGTIPSLVVEGAPDGRRVIADSRYKPAAQQKSPCASAGQPREATV